MDLSIDVLISNVNTNLQNSQILKNNASINNFSCKINFDSSSILLNDTYIKLVDVSTNLLYIIDDITYMNIYSIYTEEYSYNASVATDINSISLNLNNCIENAYDALSFDSLIQPNIDYLNVSIQSIINNKSNIDIIASNISSYIINISNDATNIYTSYLSASFNSMNAINISNINTSSLIAELANETITKTTQIYNLYTDVISFKTNAIFYCFNSRNFISKIKRSFKKLKLI
jgi:hypothetical protein